ncbi:DNA-processing protein DprA [Ornithobacterium rhinotracheale]|uniref:DNA-processing protein DprA n=1 Tax=Ornithobacterium rhinotracheale TaxID=28251 RepID=UPI001FF24C94|nr:DNA-processing protein DprA [Ornithobacterium rhinotracheale]MCK0202557.1 DNA-processing protein DprA [Ornithobacterium rhinotracheale]
MYQDNDLKYLLALNYVSGIGAESAKQLISHFGSAKSVWELSTKEKLSIQNLSPKKIEGIGNTELLERAEKEIELCEQKNIKILSFYSEDFPYLLKQCSDSPCFIFHRGEMDWKDKKFIGIVGTRNMTPRGEEFIQKFVADLADQPVVIVSGLALGVDAAAHRAALENNLPTLGVLAHSVHEIYPRANEATAMKMLKNGGLISSFSSFHRPQREFFLSRNRVIAGLSDATIIVESAVKGGAMSTATHANNYNRDVFAVPGRVDDTYSKGCHHLIKSHKAFLLTEAKDVLNYLNLTPQKKQKPIQRELFINFSPEEKEIIKVLRKNNQLHIDEIALNLKKPGFALMSDLLNLEMKGIIRPLSGKNYELIS